MYRNALLVSSVIYWSYLSFFNSWNTFLFLIWKALHLAKISTISTVLALFLSLSLLKKGGWVWIITVCCIVCNQSWFSINYLGPGQVVCLWSDKCIVKTFLPILTVFLQVHLGPSNFYWVIILVCKRVVFPPSVYYGNIF